MVYKKILKSFLASLFIFQITNFDNNIFAKGYFNNLDKLKLETKLRQNLLSQQDKEVLEKTEESLEKAISLYNEGKYKEAISLAQQAVDIRKEKLGDSTLALAKAFNILGKAYFFDEDFDRAESFFIKALEIRKKILGQEHTDIAEVLNNLGLLYEGKREYEKAEELYLKALEMRKKLLGEEHLDTILIISNLGQLYELKNSFEKAESLYIKALEVRKKLLGEEHIDVAESLNYLGLFYYEVGKFSQAEPLLNKALEINKKLLGEEHLKTANIMNNLANLYLRKGKYLQAKPLLVKVLEINRKLFKDGHSNLATVLNNMAGFYVVTGQYSQAEVLYKEALELNKKILGEENLDVAFLLNELGVLYSKIGEYNESEKFLTKALEMRRKFLPENNPFIASSLNNLAVLYEIKGDDKNIESLYLKAIDIYKQVLGEESNSTVTTEISLAVLYAKKGEFEKAEKYYLKAIKVYKQRLGEQHPFIANVFNLLGSLYEANQNYLSAEEFLVKALEMRKNIFGEDNVTYAISLSKLASFYINRKEYVKAESLLVKALEIRQKKLGETHPLTIDLLQTLVLLRLSTREYDQALKYSKEASDFRERELSKTLSIGSERQKQAYLEKYKGELNLALSLHLQALPENSLACKLALEQIFRRKGRAIDAINQNIETLRQRAKPEDVILLDNLSEKKKLFSNLTILGIGRRDPEEYKEQLKLLEKEIEELEYKISINSEEFSTQTQIVTLENIKQALDKDSLLIEFISYNLISPQENVFKGKHYAVYILNNQGEIYWADLGQAKPIDNLVDELRIKLRDKSSSIDKEVKPLAKKLNELVFKPIEKFLVENKRLLIAPDSKLNLIPFASLVDKNNKYLVEKYKISYLNSGRDLLRLKVKIASKESPVIIGNPDFGPIPKEINSIDENNIFSKLAFKPLVQTEIEVRTIKNLFPEAKLFLHKKASSETLSQVNSPKILHIATHGFFLAESNLNNKDLSGTRVLDIVGSENIANLQKNNLKNPLLRSGLALAGANIKDNNGLGIFTALKTTALNLWGTKLVVLSACDTGLGEIKNGDGIYGLRRSLVLAGSETQLISLWPVSDKATRDLMIGYYKKLKANIGRSDSLRLTQLNMLRSHTYSHPFYWGSFISSGEWANLAGKR
ncbi:MAG: tetratricopeptide repeat protein [Acidobacteria bacterium]|nr:tetratricopeptide repeat protein [Acidobacteriota bacterium]